MVTRRLFNRSARNVSLGTWNWLRANNSESGQAIFELAIVAALLILMAAGAMWFGLMAYARLAADTASYDCATAASQSLDRNQGFAQGIIAAQETARGFRFSPEDVNIQVIQPAVWDRGQEVSCRVTIHIRGNGLPLIGLFGEPRPASARTALLIERYKSYWR